MDAKWFHFQLAPNATNGAGAIAYFEGSTNWQPNQNPGTLPTNEWRHMVFVVEPGDNRVYQNGQRVQTDTGNYGTITTLTLGGPYIGRGWPTANHREINGYIDELAIYTHALSDERVQAHFRAAIQQAAIMVSIL